MESTKGADKSDSVSGLSLLFLQALKPRSERAWPEFSIS